MPIWTIVPARVTVSSAVAIAGSAPEHSTTTSGASPANGRSAVEVSKPSRRASSRRTSSPGAPRTWTRPPLARATCAASRPIAPGPSTSTSSPASMLAGSESELQTQASGSQMAAARSLSESGTRCRLRAGMRMRGANAPSTCVPTDWRCGQMLGRPARHQRHVPQVAKNVSEVTRAPAQEASTPAPELGHDAAQLVPDRERRHARVLPGLDVQVGAADARGEQLDHDLARAGDDVRALGVGDVPRAWRELGDALHVSASV